jgi:predicted TIM-barrel fold metal-dependent hydrolase
MEDFIETMGRDYRERIRKLRFFDSNCWIGRVNNRGPVYMRTVGDLMGSMDSCGIEKAMVSHALARYSHPRIGNELLLQEIANQKRLVGCFVLLPHGTGELGRLEDYVENMIARGVRAARIFPESQRFSMEDWSADRLLGCLAERRIPLFIWSREISWPALHRMCRKYPRLPVVAEQCDEETYRNLRYLYPLLEECGNLSLEVHNSHLYLQTDDIVKRFGAERLVFSTYYPVDDPHCAMMLITHGAFSSEEKEKVAHGNLESLLNGVVR